MNPRCPNCPAGSAYVVANGSYFRRGDSRRIRTFRCKSCNKYFSNATFSPNYRQKKRRINAPLFKLLAMGLTQRDAADFFNVNRKTIARRLVFFGEQARMLNEKLLEQYQRQFGPIEELQFDDLITIEHTKCKPVSLTVAVESHSRIIINSTAAQIPASGHLAAISRKKYGKRADLSRKARHELFAELSRCLVSLHTIKSDQHKDYPPLIKRHFSHCEHQCYKGVKSAISGQGELKKTRFDPLFSINHSLAMLRAKTSRLFRRTWNTTKRIERLLDHVAIYTLYHNRKIIKKLQRTQESEVNSHLNSA